MNIFKRFNKNLCITIVLFLFFVFFSIESYSKTIISDLSSSVFRLHVIANSDSYEDQELKYKVRDSLINYMNGLTINSKSKLETIAISKKHINDFQKVAQQTVKDNGYNYDVFVEIGNFYFPTKSYGDISFPSGSYDALKVKIGKSAGHNWWCVMFPPLCFIDITTATVPEDSKSTLKDSLSDEEYSLISQNTNTSEFKFKIVELFNNFSTQVAQK